MTPVTRNDLEKYIKEVEVEQEIKLIMLETIEEMKHHKNIGKKFTDRLEEKGLHAYIQRDGGFKRLIVRKKGTLFQNYDGLRFSFYNEVMTWEGILERLNTWNFTQEIIDLQEKIKTLGKDLEIIQGLLDYLDQNPMLNYDFWRMKSDLREILDRSK